MPVCSFRRFAPASYRSRPALRRVSEAPPQPIVVILGVRPRISDLGYSRCSLTVRSWDLGGGLEGVVQGGVTRNSLSRLCLVQMRDHSPWTFSSPRSRNAASAD